MASRCVIALIGCIAFSCPERGIAAEETVNSLIEQSESLYDSGKLKEATTVAEKALAEAERLNGPESTELTEALHLHGMLHIKQRQYTEAGPILQRAVSIVEKAKGPDHLELGRPLTDLGNWSANTGKVDEGEALLRRALKVREQGLGADHPDVADSYYELSELLFARGRPDLSFDAIERSIAIREKAFGADSPKIADSLHKLGVTATVLRRFSRAEDVLKRSIEISTKSSGAEDAKTLKMQDALANVYQATGRNEDAEVILKRILESRKSSLGPTHPEVAEAYYQLGDHYRAARRFDDAEQNFKTAIEITEAKSGPSDPKLARPLNGLAFIYVEQRRYSLVEQIYQRVLRIRERAFGPNHRDVAATLRDLALVNNKTHRKKDVENLLKRALAIHEADPSRDAMLIAGALLDLGNYHLNEFRYDTAESLVKRGIELAESVHGSDHPTVASMLATMATIHRNRGQVSEAEALNLRVLSIAEAPNGPINLAPRVLNSLAMIAGQAGRDEEAEAYHKKCIEVAERIWGRNHPSLIGFLNNYAEAQLGGGRYKASEALFRRGLAIGERFHGPDDPVIANSLHQISTLYVNEGRASDALPLAERALRIRETKIGSSTYEVAYSLNTLSNIYRALGRKIEAEGLQEKSLQILEKIAGPRSVDVAMALNNLAGLFEDNGRDADRVEQMRLRVLEINEDVRPGSPLVARALANLAATKGKLKKFGEAEKLLRRAIELRVALLGEQHPDTINTIADLAYVQHEQNQLPEAAELLRRSVTSLAQRLQRGDADLGAGAGAAVREFNALRNSSVQLIKILSRNAEARGGAANDVVGETFEAAQWAQTTLAGSSVDQMAARSAEKNPDLAKLVRSRQDALHERRNLDRSLVQRKSLPPDRRKRQDETQMESRIASLDQLVTNLDARLQQMSPDFSELTNPKPVSMQEAQAALGPDEALILFLTTGEYSSLPAETFVWAVTKSDAKWARISKGPREIFERVADLRCGLDQSAWTSRNSDCLGITGVSYTSRDASAGKLLPFNKKRAFDLYKALFADIEPLIEGKKLLIGASGALTQLPFHVLVTRLAQDGAGEASPAWLARSHAITVLPSASSFTSLRRAAHAPVGNRKSYLAFANPLLDGVPGDAAAASRSVLAKEKTDCARVREIKNLTRVASEYTFDNDPMLGGGNVSDFRKLAPVPQTADLACDMAETLSASDEDVRLGARATETAIKELNASGALANYAVLTFATHGLVAGEIGNNREPGLVLTPPDKPSARDDGYLSASEVTSLRLDADWVILSACNTASGTSGAAEALSGLARSFFYAGTRALLVSHWSVRESAAVSLLTKAATQPATVGRSEAVRQAMMSLADSNDASISHPSYWGAFVVVGEGAGN